MNRRWIAVLMLALIAMGMTGCSMCQGPDNSYGYYGGLNPRTDPAYGRAGSIITGGDTIVTSAEGVEEDAIISDDGETYYEELE